MPFRITDSDHAGLFRLPALGRRAVYMRVASEAGANVRAIRSGDVAYNFQAAVFSTVCWSVLHDVDESPTSDGVYP